MHRRRFLMDVVNALWAVTASKIVPAFGESDSIRRMDETANAGGLITLFVGGDVMTGRGIDQILPHPGDPGIHEPVMTSALGYLRLAEKRSGSIPAPVGWNYIWGSALEILAQTDARIINLETSVTTSNNYWRGKDIHYRMHPANLPCLGAARIDCCMLANNHVLDWGHKGLEETLSILQAAGFHTAGAGRNVAEAEQPAILSLPGGGRLLVFGLGATTSGIPRSWAATAGEGGVNLLEDLGARTLRRLGDAIERHKRDRDLVIASIHWGGNWGYTVPADHRQFAHGLIDAGLDVVHGHSSHHPLGIEVYRERPILYGCGDLLNDYEGIAGYARFRGDLSLLYLLRMEAGSGRLLDLEMVPQQIRRFRLNRASAEDAEWLRDTLGREGQPLGTRVVPGAGGNLHLQWG